jgi:hydrogenase/urease accessory protein HupE
MAELVYGLCALAAAICGTLLFRGYRRTRFPLLLWSALCFLGLTVTNVLLVVDKLMVPETDLTILRLTITLGALLVFLAALIFEGER